MPSTTGASDHAITRRVDGDGELPPPADNPERVDRFVVIERVGRGGMGEVWRAYDPKLRREVAIKLVRAVDPNAAARTLREARALAQLRHPNVAAVYDVGEAERSRVFLAMEYVDGQTLRRWLGTRRSWREVIDVFCAAGRGLAAAHRVGLVHRDVKPDNVIVSPAEGHASSPRVCVVDFGLARPEGTGSESAASSDSLDPALRDRDEDALTEEGTVLGTPAYMAPEQFRGAPADPKSDQYAFCVALFEALVGERPAREAPRMPGGTGVPASVREAVLRGLSHDPHDRFATLDDLLVALGSWQARARRRWTIAAALTLVLVPAAALGGRELDLRRRTRACEATGASIAEVWNVEQRARLRDALVATGADIAADTADKLMPWIDRYAADWQLARTDACLATDVHERWDAATLELATWCLDERRLELEALTSELMAADVPAVQKAVSAAADLPPIAACSDPTWLAHRPPPPHDQRAAIRDVQHELARAETFERTGRYDEGLAAARRARERADAIDWPPLHAAADVTLANLHDHLADYEAAERIARAAYFAAMRAGAWETAAHAATTLAIVVGEGRGRHAEGLEWVEHARVAQIHAGDNQGLREVERLTAAATIHYEAGDFHSALAENEQTLVIRERLLGADHPAVAAALNNVALSHFGLGNYDSARTLHERALAGWAGALGSEHPTTAIAVNNLANLHYILGDHATAGALYARALAIRERAFGPDHPHVAESLANLAATRIAVGELDEARRLYERALAIRERTHGPDHPAVAVVLHNLGIVTIDQGDTPRARELFERALAIRERALGSDHHMVADTLLELSIVAKDEGDLRRAADLLERAREIDERALGHAHPDLALVLGNLATIREMLGETRAARGLVERAVAIYDRHDGVQAGESTARFMLARSIVATGGDEAFARRQAELARDGLQGGGTHTAAELAEIETWLHGDGALR